VADAGFDIDGLAAVVDYGEERLLLVAQAGEVAELAVIGVMLERDGPGLGEIVIDPRRRREIERAYALPAIVDDRVENQIDWAESHADDRPDLSAIARRLPMPRVVAELEIDYVEKLMLGDMRLGEKEADLAAVDEGRPSRVME
jgi:hypothetical protein